MKRDLYIQEVLDLPLTVKQWIEENLKGLNLDSRRFFIHIMNCSIKSNQTYIPISQHKFIRRFCKNVDLKKLDQLNLVHYLDHDKESRRCRLYFLDARFKKRLVNSIKDALEEPVTLNHQDLLSVNHKRYDKQYNKESELIQQSLDQLQFGLANLDLDQLRRLQQDKSKKSKEKLKLGFYNLKWFLVRKQAIQIGKHCWKYHLAYKVGDTGRIYEIGGGVQNAAREIKSICYNLPDVHNYDLRSSLFNCMLEMVDSSRIALPTIQNYVTDKSMKTKYAEEAGVTVHTWKEIVYSLVMGGNIQYLKADSAFSGIYSNEMERLGIGKETEAMDWFRTTEPRIMEVIEPFRKEFRLWNRFLSEDWIRGNACKHKGNSYVRNSLGKRLRVDDLGSRRLKKVSAHVLQGLEARFIHTVTILSAKYGYQVIGNEHDGVVTLGVIPDQAIREARKMAGFSRAVLEEKEFY